MNQTAMCRLSLRRYSVSLWIEALSRSSTKKRSARVSLLTGSGERSIWSVADWKAGLSKVPLVNRQSSKPCTEKNVRAEALRPRVSSVTISRCDAHLSPAAHGVQDADVLGGLVSDENLIVSVACDELVPERTRLVLVQSECNVLQRLL